MKYFFDTEFIEDGKTIDLISIGIVAEDGRKYYAEFLDCNLSRASDWVKENVVPHLWSRPSNHKKFEKSAINGISCEFLPRDKIAKSILRFCDPDKYGEPEFWAYYADYDWVALCQLFGTMMDLPKGWPMYCRDIKQICDMAGNPKLPDQKTQEHHALEDALWAKDAWSFLNFKLLETQIRTPNEQA